MPTNPPLFRNGANVDTRPPEQKDEDFKFEEIVASANPVVWKEKTPTSWRKFPIFNQNGSGSCVAQTEAKELGIMRWLKDGTYVHFSATDIYQRRANKPGGGMAAVDARSIARAGVTLEVLAPSQNLTDEQMDTAVVEDYKHQVGAVFAAPNYVEVDARNIDTIASIIQTTQKGVMVWFYFELPEWTEKPTVVNNTLAVNSPSALRHSVTAVDFTLYQGKKALIIEDSWGTSFGVAGQRIITEDFFKVRNWYAGYLVNFKFDGGGVKPTYDGSIVSLQKCLRYEGLFPSNVDFIENYGPVTKKAVIEFQKRYSIAPAAGVVGPLTVAKLKELFP